VAASPYAEICHVPWAAVGALVYLLIISFALFGWAVPEFSRFSFRFLFVISASCVLFDAYLAFVGFAILKLICIVCIFTYFVNLGILLLSKCGAEATLGGILREVFGQLPFLERPSERSRTTQRLFFAINAVIVLFGLLLIVGLRWHFVGEKLNTASRILDAFSKHPPATLNVDGAPRLGPEDARVRIVEFSDFRCPYCKNLASALKVIQKRYPKDVAIYFKHYPLDSVCNPYVQRSLHPEACKLAQMGICAGNMGFFWRAEDLLFTSDKQFMDNFKRYLTDHGLAQNEFWACYSRQDTHQILFEDIQEGRDAGVSATPTIFINGQKMEGYFEPLILSQVIEAVLAKQGARPR
jgi:protein-disulfide isomerase